MQYKINFEIFVLFLIFFVITYYEDLNLSGMSFASLWKIPFIVYWIYYTYIFKRERLSDFPFVIIGGVFCLLLPLHVNFLNSAMPEITDALKYIIIPITFVFLIEHFKTRRKTILKFLFWLAVFMIWVNVPYLLGLIEPKAQRDYSFSFGEEMLDNAGFSGANMNIHTQAVYMSTALLFILFLIIKFPKHFKISNPFLITTNFIGLYSLYLSFARTGWVFFAIGIVVILFYGIRLAEFKKILPYAAVILISITALYISNDSFRKRLIDDREYTVENDKINQIGSGRLMYAAVALDNWYNSENVYTIFKGYGSDAGKDKMYDVIGNRIFAHNAYIEIIQRSGLIGIFLFLTYVIFIYKFIKTLKGPFSILIRAYFFGWLFVGLVQEFTFVYLNLFIASLMAYSYLYTKSKIYAKQ